jgi:hypothetical protein
MNNCGTASRDTEEENRLQGHQTRQLNQAKRGAVRSSAEHRDDAADWSSGWLMISLGYHGVSNSVVAVVVVVGSIMTKLIPWMNKANMAAPHWTQMWLSL